MQLEAAEGKQETGKCECRVCCRWILALALCLLAFLSSSGRGGMGYGYLLLDAIDPVEEVGDLAGDSVLKRNRQN